MTTKIQVSLDGGITFVDAPSGVIVHHLNVEGVYEDCPVDFHFVHSTEGLITDAWESTGKTEHLGTESADHEVLFNDLI